MFPGKRRYELVKLPEKWRYGLEMFPEKENIGQKDWERRHGPETFSEISSFVLEIFHEIRHGLETYPENRRHGLEIFPQKEKTWARKISWK